MEKRILVISWYFPPINSSEGIVTYKLINNSKYEYDVFTQTGNTAWSYKLSKEIEFKPGIQCFDAGNVTFDVFKNKAIAFFKKNQDKYDIVMTRSMPEVDHSIGLEIKKINPSIVWIASFGDPIANNPYTLKISRYNNYYALSKRYERYMSIREMFSIKRILKSLRYEYIYKRDYKRFTEPNVILERETLNQCDYTIYNSDYQRDYMLSFYDNQDYLNKKAIVLPHTFDYSLYSNKPRKSNGKIVFNFVGHLDDIRTPRNLLIALARLKYRDEDLGDKVEFNFYGNVSQTEKMYMLDNDLFDICRLRKPVGYLASLEKMQNADWLIHIDANISDIVEKNIFFAAKIADYIGSKRNMMAITMLEGASADIFRKYNALCLENNPEEILNYLYLIIYENYSKPMNEEYRENFNAVHVAATFDELISSLRERN